MGTTSEKLTYLNTTKTLIKEELNLGGANITNEPFREYKGKLEGIYKDFLANGTDTLWNNWEKVTGSGTEITLNNTIEAKMDFVYKGNTYQYSTTGKNLFQIPNTQTVNGITLTKNEDGTFNLEGTATANSNIYLSVNLSASNIKNGTYTISKKSSGYNTQMDFYNGYTWISTPIYVYGNNSSSSANITIPSNAINVRFIIYVANGNSINLTNEYVQLEKGSQATPYEEYTGNQPSPSPDYPQNVQVVTGDNEVKVEGKNLASDNDSSTTRNFAIGDVEEGVNYTLYLNIDGTDINGNIKYDSASGTNAKVFYTATGKNVYTFTSSKTTKIYMNSYNGTNFNGFTEIMLVKGTYTLQTIGDYEPYVSQIYPINLRNIELCKIGDYQDRIYKDNGKWYLNKQIGKVVLDGSESYGVEQSGGYYRFNLTKSDLYNYDGRGTYAISNYYHAQEENGYGVIITYRNRIMLYPSDTSITTEALFKAWLASNNTNVYYVLATPTTTEITDTTLISQLEAIKKSYNNQTNISQTNADKPFILDVVALGELEI